MGHASGTAIVTPTHADPASNAHEMKMPADSDESEVGVAKLLRRSKARPKNPTTRPAKRKTRPQTTASPATDTPMPPDTEHPQEPTAQPPRAPPPVEEAPGQDATDGNREKRTEEKECNPTLTGSMDEYRTGVLRLEKIRHTRMYESEKRRLCLERSIEILYETQIREAEEDFEAGRRALISRLLQENMEKTRRVEELRYKIVRDDHSNVWSRRHEMSLRGRGAGHGDDADHAYGRSGIRDDDFGHEIDREKPQRRSRKNDGKNSGQPKAKLNLALSEADALKDLTAITGEKRREPETHHERRSKKRK